MAPSAGRATVVGEMRSAPFAAVAFLAAFAFSSRAAADEPPPSPPSPPALEKPPRLTHFVEAEPPARLAELGSADVILAIDVDATGNVTSVTIAQSAGPDFDEAALAAARQFVFEPGEAGGKKVPVRITYRYRFVVKPATTAPPPEAPAVPETPTIPVGGVVLRKGDRVPLAGISVLLDDGRLNA